MNGPAKVIIDNSRGEYVLLGSQGLFTGVMTTAGVKAVQYVVMPEDLLLGRWGPKSDRLLGDVWTPQSCDELHRFRIADVVKADIRWLLAKSMAFPFRLQITKTCTHWFEYWCLDYELLPKLHTSDHLHNHLIVNRAGNDIAARTLNLSTYPS